MYNDIQYMKFAIKEAKKALKYGDIPIGAIIVYNKNTNNKIMSALMKKYKISDGDIVSKGYNKRNKIKSSIAHAEILSIDKACKKIKDFRLEDCTMYVTLEPCQMCAGAIVQSRIKRLVIGAKSMKSGSCGTIIDILDNNNFNHKVKVDYGICEEECSEIIKNYFKRLRK